MFITMGVCGVLSQFLMFPLDNIVSTDGGQTVVEKEDNTNDNKHSYVSNEIETNNNPVEPDPEEENKKVYVNEPFMQAFKSWRFQLFNFMSVGTLCK